MIILVYFSIYIDYSILIFSPIFSHKIIPEVHTKLGVLKIIPLQRVHLKLGQLWYTLQNKFLCAKSYTSKNENECLL